MEASEFIGLLMEKSPEFKAAASSFMGDYGIDEEGLGAAYEGYYGAGVFDEAAEVIEKTPAKMGEVVQEFIAELPQVGDLLESYGSTWADVLHGAIIHRVGFMAEENFGVSPHLVEEGVRENHAGEVRNMALSLRDGSFRDFFLHQDAATMDHLLGEGEDDFEAMNNISSGIAQLALRETATVSLADIAWATATDIALAQIEENTGDFIDAYEDFLLDDEEPSDADIYIAYNDAAVSNFGNDAVIFRGLQDMDLDDVIYDLADDVKKEVFRKPR